MNTLTKLLFGTSGKLADGLAPELRAAIESWRDAPAADPGRSHFQTRYVVVDIATSGLEVGEDRLLGIAAIGVQGDGLLLPGDSFVLEPVEPADEAADRGLAAFLGFVGQAPLVTFQAPFVGAFLERIFHERFRLAFQPEWIDLAWLLPDLFKERIDGVVPLDDWLEAFAISVPGRRDALADAVALARLLQAALPRARQRGAESPARLLDIGRARRWLRHNG